MLNPSGPAAPDPSTPNSPCHFALSPSRAESGTKEAGDCLHEGCCPGTWQKPFCNRSVGWREATLWSASWQDLNIGACFCDALAFLTWLRWPCKATAPDQAPFLLPPATRQQCVSWSLFPVNRTSPQPLILKKMWLSLKEPSHLFLCLSKRSVES